MGPGAGRHQGQAQAAGMGGGGHGPKSGSRQWFRGAQTVSGAKERLTQPSWAPLLLLQSCAAQPGAPCYRRQEHVANTSMA